MIDFLEGTIEELRERYLLINVNGTGFGVNITSGAYYALKQVSGQVRIYTYMNVKEDAVDLFGFSGNVEKEMFKVLIGISGIGAKAAVNILSNIDVEKLKKAIGSGNAAVLTSVPGLGAKKAQRILVELKDKFKHLEGGGPVSDDPGTEEYIQALTKLGFTYTQSRQVINEVVREQDKISKEDIIKEAIKRMGK